MKKIYSDEHAPYDEDFKILIMKKIYLAVPYTHEDPEVVECRVRMVNILASRLVNDGYNVFSPISHFHPIAAAGGLPTDWEAWKEIDASFIDWADELWVFCLPDWDVSKGVREEIKLAEATDKPVRYLVITDPWYLIFDKHFDLLFKIEYPKEDKNETKKT